MAAAKRAKWHLVSLAGFQDPPRDLLWRGLARSTESAKTCMSLSPAVLNQEKPKSKGRRPRTYLESLD